MKYYIRQCNFPERLLHMYKVYDKMPEDMPEVFKKSRLICFDEIKIVKPVVGAVYKFAMMHHSMTDKETMKVHLEGFTEVSEEEYDSLYNRCATLKDSFDEMLPKFK